MAKKFYVTESRIDNKGIFASRDIKKAEVVFLLKGKISHKCPGTKLKTMPCPLCANWIGIGDMTWIDPDKDNPCTFINHSCDPNVGIKGTITFCALRPIKKGEEICFDYSITEEDGAEWQMKCNCKAKKCRKDIGGIISLSQKTFDSYLPYIPKYFQEVYTNYLKL